MGRLERTRKAERKGGATQMRAGRAFSGFQEAKIEFAPTFKYDVGTQVPPSNSSSPPPPPHVACFSHRSQCSAKPLLIPPHPSPVPSDIVVVGEGGGQLFYMYLCCPVYIPLYVLDVLLWSGKGACARTTCRPMLGLCLLANFLQICLLPSPNHA